MSVTIRLARHGAKKNPHYRIVVADRRNPRDGRLLEQVGLYDPSQNPAKISFDEKKLAAWISRGATPSLTVSQLMKKSGYPHATPAEADPTT